MSLPPEYRSTVFILEDPPSPLPASFAIVTAWNPMDEITPLVENEKRDAELRKLLELRLASYFRATGCSPDLCHREPGWAMATAQEEALELGRQFRQRAIWWIEEDDLFLVDCANGGRSREHGFMRRVVSGRKD